jgi:hypothetical protein
MGGGEYIMQFSKLNREGAENMYRTVKNVQGATITTGLPVSIRPTAASVDGISAVISDATADHYGFIGVAFEDIANNDYGLIQVNGLINSIYVSNAGTSITITAGDYIVPATSGVGFYSGALPALAANNAKTMIAADSATVSATGYVRGILAVL